MGLLFVILSVIFMKGGVVRESEQKHEEFGDVRKTITDEFVRQRYLEYIRIPHTEPVEYEFRWGQRADVEVSKAQILVFMGQVSI
ncbi:hypothetical protein XENOCAPTIV_000900 [Xenoophorus captivus]|uniref:MAGE domain-containing protein n=1 Tax=Xenoophorus captivus TaxID=1517983 RepID=A0ABV0REQ7_9TELE